MHKKYIFYFSANNVGFHDVAYTSSGNKRFLSDFKLIVPKDPFYDGCNTLKNCFGSPEGCVQSQNCAAVTAIKVEGTRYTFELKGRTPAYVAVGLSDDAKMVGFVSLRCNSNILCLKLINSHTSILWSFLLDYIAHEKLIIYKSVISNYLSYVPQNFNFNNDDLITNTLSISQFH